MSPVRDRVVGATLSLKKKVFVLLTIRQKQKPVDTLRKCRISDPIIGEADNRSIPHQVCRFVPLGYCTFYYRFIVLSLSLLPERTGVIKVKVGDEICRICRVVIIWYSRRQMRDAEVSNISSSRPQFVSSFVSHWMSRVTELVPLNYNIKVILLVLFLFILRHISEGTIVHLAAVWHINSTKSEAVFLTASVTVWAHPAVTWKYL